MVCHKCLQCTFFSFKFSVIIKKENRANGSRRLTVLFRTVLFDDPAASFPFPFAIFVFCFVFSFPIFCFSLAILIPSISTKIPDKTHTTHTQNVHTYAYEKKKGHADCHAYRTLDPRRPVYDELSIHPPPRRNVAVPGEEVNQSGASLYAGK